MTGDRDPLQRFEPGQHRPRRSKPYTIECSAAFLPGGDPEDAKVLTIGTVTDLIGSRCDVASADIPDDLPPRLLDRFDDRVRQLFREALSGYFYIGAVRDPHTYIELADQEFWDNEWGGWTPIVTSRHVGAKGENSWILETIFSNNKMMPVSLGEYQPQHLDGRRCLELFSESSRSEVPKLARIWDLASPGPRSVVSVLNPDSVPEPEAAGAVANMLNSVLDREDLFSMECWGTPQESVDAQSEVNEVSYTIENRKIEYYLRYKESWDHDDLTVFNRLLVEDALGVIFPSLGGERECNFPSFNAYVSRWTSDLTDASLNILSYESLADLFREPMRADQWRFICPAQVITPQGYAGYLFFPEPVHTDLSSAGASMKRMLHPCFGVGTSTGGLQPPRQLSSGFHQVFPIVVQLGLMRQGELVGIENPEVHLHPSMQLRVAKMLIDHANSGRHILVETHSDLLIRRVIRAILAEEIRQTRVRVYFVDLRKSTETITGADAEWGIQFRHSTLNKLQVDERGRIANWPEGFMDDDVKESQRLLDIMYGGNEEGEDEDA